MSLFISIVQIARSSVFNASIKSLLWQSSITTAAAGKHQTKPAWHRILPAITHHHAHTCR
jgi:hypothetical protein